MKIIFALFTKTVTFYLKVSIIKIRVFNLDRSYGDTFLLWKRSEDWKGSLVLFQVDFYKLVEQIFLAVEKESPRSNGSAPKI